MHAIVMLIGNRKHFCTYFIQERNNLVDALLAELFYTVLLAAERVGNRQIELHVYDVFPLGLDVHNGDNYFYSLVIYVY